jgi:hypothetical protein
MDRHVRIPTQRDRHSTITAEEHGITETRFSMGTLSLLVFEGPVDWTEKMTATQPNPTKCNRTLGCSCSIWVSVGLPVASI